jgi:hypothetical protein
MGFGELLSGEGSLLEDGVVEPDRDLEVRVFIKSHTQPLSTLMLYDIRLHKMRRRRVPICRGRGGRRKAKKIPLFEKIV